MRNIIEALLAGSQLVPNKSSTVSKLHDLLSLNYVRVVDGTYIITDLGRLAFKMHYMNKDQAQAWLPLIKALADGETIEHHMSDQWEQASSINFNFGTAAYRIKPKETFKLGEQIKLHDTTYMITGMRNDQFLVNGSWMHTDDLRRNGIKVQS